MHTLFIAGLGESRSETTVDFPRPDRLIKGNPKRQTQSLYEHPNMECGIWQCEIGAWNIEFANNKQEFFTVLEGKVRLHDQNNQFIEIGVGQAAVIPPNFKGTFEVIETVKKYYVIVEVTSS